MPPYILALKTRKSKIQRAPCAFEANQEIHIATQHDICAADQDTSEHSRTYVQPFRSKKIKQWRDNRPRSDALVFRAAPSLYRGVPAYELFALAGFFDAATWLPVPDSRN